jgi:hypothetical protein
MKVSRGSRLYAAIASIKVTLMRPAGASEQYSIAKKGTLRRRNSRGSRLYAAISSIGVTLMRPAGASEQDSIAKRYVKAKKLKGEQAG